MLKSWTAPAAPPLARVWERLGQPRRRVLTAPREGRRGEGEEEKDERRGWHPARKYLKPGWSPCRGERTRQRDVVRERREMGVRERERQAEDAGRARGWERDREWMFRGCSVPLVLQPASPGALPSLPEAVAAGRTGLPPGGLPARRWQVAKLLTPLSPRTSRWVKNGFSRL